ncbi:hypothetical protein [Actinomadura madurae]|uniref:hypothetical protein n=1 Tax=Actinomadura madurae TaxID=1993 RepID=UPI0026E58F80|nr:hypothetical protein [Actinomadura madurae]
MTTSEAAERLRGWFAGRLPEDWFEDAPEIVLDREEVSVIGRLPVPAAAEGVSDAERAGVIAGHVQRFRDETRDRRIGIAREAEQRFGHKVSWGVECGGEREMFTTLSVPVMTRLRQPERRVLDTLVEAGVARSRSDALAWCVRLVGKNTDEWLAELRSALRHVERARAAARRPDRARPGRSDRSGPSTGPAPRSRVNLEYGNGGRSVAAGP